MKKMHFLSGSKSCVKPGGKGKGGKSGLELNSGEINLINMGPRGAEAWQRGIKPRVWPPVVVAELPLEVALALPATG